MTVSPDVIRSTLLDLVAQRGPNKTICPSEVARALNPEDWRSLMPTVRQVGQQLRAEGRIVVTQKGQPVDPNRASGPIRYRQAGETPCPRGDEETRP